MVDAVDRHFQMVDEHDSLRRMKDAVKVLQDAGIEFTVEGGWAVTSYGSNVASVDLDVLVPGGLTEEIAAAIEHATGYQMFSQSTRDTLALDFVDADHTNTFIDNPDRAYVPSRLLAGHTEVRAILDGVDVAVPTAPFLVFMKLKAFRDRLIQWRASRGERFLLAGMAEDERHRTMQLGEQHWLRKAGKDLFDASFLLGEHTTLDEVRAIAPQDLWGPIADAIQRVPLPLRAFAEDMAKRVGIADLAILGA